MLISCNWLARHVDLDGVDLDALGERFTMSVAELDGVHHVGRGLDTVVVGRVERVEGIESKRVRACQVDTGDGVRTIVCGAPNVAEGQLVPIALPGTVLGDMEIRVADVAGVTSHGMIASERELGLSDVHEGIMVLDGAPSPGTRLGALYDVEDTLFEIDNKSITHRPDLWGHRGVAREVAALLGRPLSPLALDVPFTDAEPLTVRVEDAEACPRYAAVTLDGVTVGQSPVWLRVLLHRVGTRAINNVVDATNFVMLDLGNPLHAFDRREITDDTIVVRAAHEGERFTTLDGHARELTPADLLIADAERGVALAGVMGGEDSEIRDDTSRVVLEAANFDGARIRTTAQRLGLRTESSARFEKRLDPRLAEDAARRFCRLLTELCPDAQVTSALMDAAAPAPPPTVITLSISLVRRRLGVPVDVETIVGTLMNLDFEVEAAGDDTLSVTVPSYRATKDVEIAADLVEEIGRIYGYDNIPPRPPIVALGRPHDNARKRFERRARAYLTLSAGLDEVQTYSFDDEALADKVGATDGPRARLRNPISAEMPALRRFLAPSLLGVAVKNARAYDHMRVCEIGRVFRPDPGGGIPHQPTTLGVMLARPPGDAARPDAGLFFTLKGVAAGLARTLQRADPTLLPQGVPHAWAHPVRQARLGWEHDILGYIAELHPRVARDLGIEQQVALLELDLDALRAQPDLPPTYTPLPRYPAVYRDFAVLVPRETPAEAVRHAIVLADPELISEVAFQSIYTGEGVAEGDKSVAWSVTLRHPERTLADPEVREVERKIWASLEAQVSGRQRA